jgi:hypothetical protein
MYWVPGLLSWRTSTSKFWLVIAPWLLSYSQIQGMRWEITLFMWPNSSFVSYIGLILLSKCTQKSFSHSGPHCLFFRKSYNVFYIYNLVWKLFPFREPLNLKEAQPVWLSLEDTRSLLEMSVILAAYSQGMVRYSDCFLVKRLGRWHLIVHFFS